MQKIVVTESSQSRYLPLHFCYFGFTFGSAKCSSLVIWLSQKMGYQYQLAAANRIIEEQHGSNMKQARKCQEAVLSAEKNPEATAPRISKGSTISVVGAKTSKR